MAKQSPTPRNVTKKHIARLERERRQVNLIRGIAVAGILAVVLLLGYGYLKLNVLQLREPVAEVNGAKITTGAWQERVRFQRWNLLNQLNLYQYYQTNFGMDTSQQMQQVSSILQSPQTLGQQVLDQMIDEALIRQEAKKRGITVTQAEVDKAIQEAYGFYPNGTPSPTITPTEFSTPTISPAQLTIYPSTSTPTEAPTATVTPTQTPDLSATPTVTSTSTPAFPTPTLVPQPATATSTPYTLDGFKKQFSKTVKDFKSYNIAEATVRSAYENQLLRAKLLDEIAKDTPHTQEQVWARHILVDDAQTSGIVRALLLSGQDFAKVAKDFSKDTGSGANGGDLGWFGKGQMVPEFETAAFSQKIGEIGEPVKSQFGYHIIQVIDRREMPVSEDQYQQSREKALTDWLAKTRQEATDAGTLTTFDIWNQRIPSDPIQLNTPAPS